jgi:polyphenol oxidase
MSILYNPVPDCYSFSRWKELPLIAGTIGRDYDFTPEHETAKKKSFLRALSIDLERMIFPQQVHADSVMIVDDSSASYQEADALVSASKNVPLAIVTADCLPVFLYCPDKEVIALVHAGWKGLRLGIISKTIDRMQTVFQAPPRDLQIAIGPAIHTCCYEVGSDVAREFPAEFMNIRTGRTYLDLSAVAIAEACALGVSRENIIDSQRCTACENEHFFSYRQEGNAAGRMASFIMLH